ncbi:MAG: Fur family transcriptional regulator [Solirubrobacteraceae bacterium]
MTSIEKLCLEKGLKMTGPRRIIARVLSAASNHPDADEVHRRAAKLESRISLATVYRTLRLFEEQGILARRDFGDGRARYEAEGSRHHHDHLIDLQTGRVVEFESEEIEELQAKLARRLGYRLVNHRLELYGVPLRKGK